MQDEDSNHYLNTDGRQEYIDHAGKVVTQQVEKVSPIPPVVLLLLASIHHLFAGRPREDMKLSDDLKAGVS